jgi:hypothetical protein
MGSSAWLLVRVSWVLAAFALAAKDRDLVAIITGD